MGWTGLSNVLFTGLYSSNSICKVFSSVCVSVCVTDRVSALLVLNCYWFGHLFITPVYFFTEFASKPSLYCMYKFESKLKHTCKLSSVGQYQKMSTLDIFPQAVSNISMYCLVATPDFQTQQ